MSNYPDILKSLLIRALIAAPFFAIGLTGAAFVLSPFFIVAGALIVATPLARMLAESWGGLFYPVRRSSRPAPMYSIPQAKRMSGHYEEAMEGFQKIADEYPGEVQPYIEMIDIAIMNFHDPDHANEVYQRGVSLMKKQKDKEALATMYSAIRSRLGAKPSN